MFLKLVLFCYACNLGIDIAFSASADNIAALFASGSSVNCSLFPATERDLRTTLLTNYSRIDRPKLDSQQPVIVIFSLVLEAIKAVEIKEHQIILSGYLYVNWYDDYLRWNQYPEYQCIKLLVIPAAEVWLPDIAAMNVPEKYGLFEASGEKVRLYPDGYVHFRPGGLFSATCEMDLTYFPYDEQECKLMFQSWLYLHSYMAITLDKNPIVQSRWTDNEEWELTNMSGIVQNVYYSNPAHPYDGVVFTLNLRRRVGFFIMNVIIPGTIISLVEMVTFSLDSGEPVKIHISFTCLLAFQVFQLMVIPEMPHSAMHTPLLSIYIILEMAYIGCVLLGQASVFLLLHHSAKKHGPPQLILSFASFWAPLVRVKIVKRSIQDIHASTFEELQEDNLTELENTGENHYAFKIDGSRDFRGDQESHMKKMLDARLVSMFQPVKNNDIFDSEMTMFGNELEMDQKSAAAKIREKAERHNRRLWVFAITVVDRVCAAAYLFLVIATPLFMFLVIPAVTFHTVRTLR